MRTSGVTRNDWASHMIVFLFFFFQQELFVWFCYCCCCCCCCCCFRVLILMRDICKIVLFLANLISVSWGKGRGLTLSAVRKLGLSKKHKKGRKRNGSSGSISPSTCWSFKGQFPVFSSDGGYSHLLLNVVRQNHSPMIRQAEKLFAPDWPRGNITRSWLFKWQNCLLLFN